MQSVRQTQRNKFSVRGSLEKLRVLIVAMRAARYLVTRSNPA